MSNKFEPIFKSDSDWHNNACLNFTHDATNAYISGYKCAADSLVIQVNETGRDQDRLVFPIVFLYRHYLELLLKSIIDEGRQLLNDEKGYPPHHRIENLWPLVKGIVRKVWSGNDPDEMIFTDHVIKELGKFDPDSMSFRYPEDKKGNKSVPEVTHINLRHLGQNIDKAGTFLEGVQMGIGSYLEYKYDSLAEHQQGSLDGMK